MAILKYVELIEPKVEFEELKTIHISDSNIHFTVDSELDIETCNSHLDIEWEGDDLLVTFPDASVVQKEEGEEYISIVDKVLVNVPLVGVDDKTLETYRTSLIITISGGFKKEENGWRNHVSYGDIVITGKIDYAFANLGLIDFNDNSLSKTLKSLDTTAYYFN